ncbi:MAG: hypothetical protein AB1642_03650 [Pseudomonadota bacterium]
MDGSSIEVLHRETGYLRLRLPAPFRSAAIGAALEDGLKALAGMQRVTWLTAEGKLATRFDPHACTHADVARRVKALLAGLPQAEIAAPAPADAPPEPAPSLAARFDDLRERLVAAAPGRFRPLVESATTEKAITNFTNDIVAFYLIKTHWELITKLWIRNPVKYGNAWLTVFYLVFLLVRYRKS